MSHTTIQKRKPVFGHDGYAEAPAEIARAIQASGGLRPIDNLIPPPEELDLSTPRKKTISIRIDEDILDWFKSLGRYQTKINRVLRLYKEAYEKKQELTSKKTATVNKSIKNAAPAKRDDSGRHKNIQRAVAE
ncbi:MAG TPA: BrnA antitoxin family protein [Spirochaetota bacterium]|nr:BrnA antitoxin family protein [Spirochaetota bacterium]